jgi:hypothetical protein
MITSTLGRMADADKLSVQQLKMAVQHGTVPAYIGIPLLQEKLKQSQQMQASQAQAPQQPPIADQIMQQASGVSELPSNMPMQYAHGGIIHMATGGYDPMSMARSLVRDDEDLEDMDFLGALGDMGQMPETEEPEGEPEVQMGPVSASSGIEGLAPYEDLTPLKTLAIASPFATSREVKQVTAKEEGRPAETLRKETSRVERPTAARDLERMAIYEGSKYNLDPSLIRHVLLKETGGLKEKASAVSPAGAIGVMQLMPGTARDMGVKDPYDPVQNIEGGVKYLAKMQRKYDDPKIAAIAYNWGPGNTDRWLAQGGDFNRLPRETQGYIRGLAQGGSVKHFVKGGDTDDDTYFQDPLGAPSYSTEDSDYKDILKQPVHIGEKLEPGLGAIFGYKVLPSRKGYDRSKSQGVGKPVPKNLPEPTPLIKPVVEPPKEEEIGISGPQSFGTPESIADVKRELDKNKPEVAPKVADTAPEKDDLREYFSKGIAGLEDQKKINAYMALLSAGLGMMGGTSPYAAANIGTGAQQGVQAYMAGNKDIAAQQNALMQGRLGLEKYQSLRDIQKQQAQNLAEYRQDKLANLQADRDRKILEGKEKASLAEERLALARMTRLKESLARKEAEAKALALAEEKNAFTPEQHAQIQARAIANLHKRRDYQSEYFQAYGELPMGAQQQTNLSQADADLVNKYLKKP